MKFLGYQEGDAVYVGRVDADNRVTRLTTVDQFYAELELWSTRAESMGPGVASSRELRLRPPVPATAKVVCVGHNYASHVTETKRSVSEYPVLFARYASTLISDGDAIPVPPAEAGLDWEVELAVIIGQRLYRSDPDECMAGVFGYTAFNDVTARAHQFHTHQFMLGKNPDKSAPMGPVIVTADEFDPAAVQLETRVNGQVMQSGNTSDMIFKIGPTLSYISQIMTLNPGDVLATGTPGGIGFRRDPQVLMHPGDVLETEVEGIGTLRNQLIAPRNHVV
jgi:2-keto-4-pentenoate hydratase/2-oxohepta-3-ene-1,7-dioic acid hydratase in catechol pathway